MASTLGFLNRTFDDRHRNSIKYNSEWFITGSWNASSVGESGTLSSSDSTTANLTFTFPTPANAFYYYGIPRCCGGSYQICIDCDPNSPNFITIDAVNATDNGQNPPVVLFSTTFDKPGVHEIILRNQPDTRFQGRSQITLDRIELSVPDPNFTPAPSTASSSLIRPASATPTSGPTATTQQAAAKGSDKNTIAAAVGGAIGGVAFLVVIILLIFLFMRKRRSRRRKLMLEETYSSGQPGFSYAPRISNVPGSLNHGFTFPARPMHTRDQTWATTAPSDSGFSSGYPASGYTTTTTGTRREARREQDAGMVMSSDDEPEMPTLPPEYEAVFRRQQAQSRIIAATPGDIPADTTSPITSESGLTTSSSGVPLYLHIPRRGSTSKAPFAMPSEALPVSAVSRADTASRLPPRTTSMAEVAQSGQVQGAGSSF